MKTQLFAKILSCLLLLPAVHAMASVVEINSDQTDYTFLSQTTYFVDTNVTLHGTTTFQTGAILKYNGSGLITIDPSGTIVCPTGIGLAIFTSMNDDSVGETIPGSSGTPEGSEIGPCDVSTFLNFTNVALTNMSFSYANDPLWNPETSTTTLNALQNCQFFHNDFVSVSTPQIVNNLFVDSYVDWWPTGDEAVDEDDTDDDWDGFDNIMMNNTFVSSQVQVDGVGTNTSVWVADNLFDSSGAVDFTTDGVVGDYNAFYDGSDYLGTNYSGLPTDITLTDDPNLQTGPLGNYYLPWDSLLINAGEDPLGDLDGYSFPFTTFTTQINQMPDGFTDDRVDIGFHYPIITTYVVINSDQTDYTFLSDTTYFIDANVTLYGTTTFQDGAILKYNGVGQLNIDSGGTLVCPASGLAIFTSINDDSVGVTIWGSSGTPSGSSFGGCDVNTFLKVSNAPLSYLSFSYANDPLWNPETSVPTVTVLQNCQFFHNDFVSMTTTQVVNNLFIDSYVDWWPAGIDDGNTYMQSNIFADNSAVQIDGVETPTEILVSDNLFETSGAIDFTEYGVSGGDNGFYDSTDYLGYGESGLPGDYTLDYDPGY